MNVQIVGNYQSTAVMCVNYVIIIVRVDTVVQRQVCTAMQPDKQTREPITGAITDIVKF